MADGQNFPGVASFAETAARAGQRFVAPKSDRISWLRTPLDGDDTFLTLPAETILSPDILPRQELERLLKGKIVVIGGAFSDRDQHLTPMSVLSGERYPGMFIQSQIIAQLTDPERRPIYGTPWHVWTFAVLAWAAVGFLSGRSERVHRWRPWSEILVVVALILTSIISMMVFRLTFPFVAALLAWGLGETISTQLTSEGGARASAAERRH